jgi:ABC-type antimicrobial peptide transport system permease subunit
LRADLTFDQAASLVQSTTKGFREQRQLPELRVVPLVNVNVSTSKAIYIMLAGVVCVLLIAIANAANLLLGDMVQRRAELAVRRSLGASRLVLARQLLVETLLRSSLAAIAALLLARWALHAIVDGVPYLMSSGSLVLIALAFGMPLALAAARGLRSLLYEVSPTDPATLTTVVAGLVIAALAATYLPARRASRVDPSEALRYE